MKLALFLFAAGLFFPACSVMTFRNGETEPSGTSRTEWRHGFGYGLYEAERPFDPKKSCGDWATVATQETFGTGLISALQYLPSSLTLGIPLNVWDVEEVEYTCGK